MKMRVPLLVAGYERSGVSLLVKLINSNPDVGDRVKFLTKDEIKSSAIDNKVAARAIAYTSVTSFVQALSITAGGLSDSRVSIVHLVRNPISVINSRIAHGTGQRKEVLNYFTVVGFVISCLIRRSDVYYIQYEDLVENPENMLIRLYKWMGCSSGCVDDVIKDNDVVVRPRKTMTCKRCIREIRRMYSGWPTSIKELVRAI